MLSRRQLHCVNECECCPCLVTKLILYTRMGREETISYQRVDGHAQQHTQAETEQVDGAGFVDRIIWRAYDELNQTPAK